MTYPRSQSCSRIIGKAPLVTIMDQVHHNARLHNSCLGQEGDDGPGHTFKERAGYSSASLYPQSLAEHLPAGIPQMFSEQNSIVLMAQGSRASEKVPGSQQWASSAHATLLPQLTAGITVTLGPPSVQSLMRWTPWPSHIRGPPASAV